MTWSDLLDTIKYNYISIWSNRMTWSDLFAKTMALSGLTNGITWSDLLAKTMALSGLTNRMTWSDLLTNTMALSGLTIKWNNLIWVTY